ncbi:hypothetical protein LSH36_1106g00030 [Paralvinella palmiformis]|uniref:Uncharacterized protein n=1 Tax=Paralvinella palmiformis TaxID=53620 RepID=A0AAD9MQ78_9ANNE|nr:hypothetical protein LSH36_1106g00030 [Paralvinella palmiformis]
MSPDELTELLNFYHSTPICGYHTCQDLARLHMEWCKRCRIWKENLVKIIQ